MYSLVVSVANHYSPSNIQCLTLLSHDFPILSTNPLLPTPPPDAQEELGSIDQGKPGAKTGAEGTLFGSAFGGGVKRLAVEVLVRCHVWILQDTCDIFRISMRIHVDTYLYIYSDLFIYLNAHSTYGHIWTTLFNHVCVYQYVHMYVHTIMWSCVCVRAHVAKTPTSSQCFFSGHRR